jgi:hypothetical protein
MRSCVGAAVFFVMFVASGVPSVAFSQADGDQPLRGASFEAGLGSVTIDGYARSAMSDAASSVWGSSGRLSGAANGSITRFATGTVSAYGELHGALAFSDDAVNLSSLRIDGGGGSYRGNVSSHYLQSSVLLGRSSTSSKFAGWIDAGAGSAGISGPGNKSHVTLQAQAGGSARTASAIVRTAIGVASVGSTTYGDVNVHTAFTLFGDDALEVARLVAGIDGGLRSGAGTPGPHGWASGVATFRLTNPVSLVAHVGTEPSDPLRGTTGAAYTSISVRVAFGAAALRPIEAIARAPRATRVSEELGGSRRVITVLLAAADSVELMGDFTGWLPVRMTRSGPDVWTARVVLSQGSHRMNIRRDAGPWVVPPDMPAAADDFGGSVGILVVP